MLLLQCKAILVVFMSNVFEVDPQELIKRAAGKLRDEKIKRPGYVDFVKTGPGKERPPADREFWYTRCASILRQVYVSGPVGVSRLRTRYGARKDHTVHRHHHLRAGGSMIKDAFDSLESLGYIKKGKVGREITPKGKAFLDKLAKEIAA